MNKKKFDKKCQELIDYENKAAYKLEEFIKPFNNEMIKKGYEIIVRRFWFYSTVNKGIENFSLSRIKIVVDKGYFCSFGVQFQLLGANPDNDDGLGFQIMETATAYGKGIVRLHSFKKYKLQYLYKKTEECFFEIMQKGLEVVALRYND